MLITSSDGQMVIVDAVDNVEVDTDDDPGTTSPGAPPGVTRLYVHSGAHGVAVVERGGETYALVAVETTDELMVYRLGSRAAPRYDLCERIPIGRDLARNEDPWDVVVMPNGLKAYVSFRGAGTNLGDAIAVIDVPHATDCMARGDEVTRYIAGVFGAPGGIGAMALNSGATRLAMTVRRASYCNVPVWSRNGPETIDMPVGCDSVLVLDTATDTMVTLPTPGYLHTMPAWYPYAVAWFPDGARLAYAMFSNPTMWPVIEPPLDPGGAVRLGTLATSATTYNAAVPGNVLGESLIISPPPDEAWLYVGTSSGAITALPTTTAFWQDTPVPRESSIHGSAWYGGCRAACTAGPGQCPALCPSAASLGSPIRAMIAY